MKQNKSMVTGSDNIEHFIDLRNQPNGNIFFDKENISNEELFSLKMSVCKDSWLVQLEEFPTPSDMFDEHPYISGYSQPVVTHFKWFSNFLVNKLNIAKGSLVIDIGANDGSLLSCFKNLGLTTLGVDPGKYSGEYAKKNEILVLRKFWNKETGSDLSKLNVKPSLITATAVFYHVPDLHNFISGLKAVMSEDTVFVCQCVYLMDVIKKLQFDHFYHEHTCVYSVYSLVKLFELNDMKVIDVTYNTIHGGSIIVEAVKNTSSRIVSENVNNFIKREKEFGLFDIKTYHNFSARVSENIQNLKSLLIDLKSKGKSVYGIGAPVKGSTLLNYAEVKEDLIQKIVEVNKLKIGKVVPGVHIPIISEDQANENHPDYYIVMAWNFKEYFLEKYKDYIKNGGKLIIPNPTLHIEE